MDYFYLAFGVIFASIIGGGTYIAFLCWELYKQDLEDFNMPRDEDDFIDK